MDDRLFKEPALALNRIYTKTGDGGETSLVGGQRVSKDSRRLECYGTVDELNAFTGAAAVTARESGLDELAGILERVQHELFNLGSILATDPADIGPRQPRITEAEVRQLEAEMDRMNEHLPALRSFVLPGGTRLNAELHLCRTVCRRAERAVVALRREANVDSINIHYLNRLSDAFFVYSRRASQLSGVEEVLWQPNQASSARRP
ncbi:MAG: cob(I)yrinic acid a,c-diamide adenosyltransferase [Bryobacteraceae bacterium]|nr:cob(I)yrinic acid a,c-diamide adenosyltransferase [Bryobacteraceae bacterium]